MWCTTMWFCNLHVAIYRLYATKLHCVHWTGIHVILIRKKNSLNIPHTHTHTQYDKSCQLHYLCHFLRLIYTSILIGFNPERIPIRVFTRESTYNLIQITTIHLVRWIKSMWLGIAFGVLLTSEDAWPSYARRSFLFLIFGFLNDRSGLLHTSKMLAINFVIEWAKKHHN